MIGAIETKHTRITPCLTVAYDKGPLGEAYYFGLSKKDPTVAGCVIKSDLPKLIEYLQKEIGNN
jgi:hypothetical protein